MICRTQIVFFAERTQKQTLGGSSGFKKKQAVYEGFTKIQNERQMETRLLLIGKLNWAKLTIRT